MDILIAVDVQNDFLPGGALAVPDGDQVIPVLIDLMNEVDLIVLTRDWHPANHASFSTDPLYVDGSWPSHCVAGTDGAVIDTALYEAAVNSRKMVWIVNKGFKQDEEAYSGFKGIVSEIYNAPDGFRKENFEGFDLAVAISHLEGEMSYHDILVGGLALDYCVKETALDTPRYYHTSVILNATRPVNYLTGALAVRDLCQGFIEIDGD